jgi:hypothetical protein
MSEKYTTGTGQLLFVHDASDCKGDACCIHNPSNHAMLNFKTHWRFDRGIMERICSHNIGHPDPDDIEFMRQNMGDKMAEVEAIHGCDGCCQKKGE